MSVEAITPSLGIPQFPAERIDTVFVASQTSPDAFRHEQLQTMSMHNNSLKAFFEAKISAFGARGESDLSDKWMSGYALGHAALRSAVGGELPLPTRETDSLHRFAQFVHRTSDRELDNVIKEDYGAHPDMLEMLRKHKELNADNNDGARFILGVYGLWANPARAPRLFLPVAQVSKPSKPADRRIQRRELKRLGL